MTQALTYKLDPAEWAEIVQEDATEPVQVRETTTTPGTGPMTLAGAVAGFQAASTVYAVGDVFEGAFTDGEDWEYGYYTLQTGGVVARSRIQGSTDGGDAINWGAGSKTFIANVPDAQTALRFLLLELAAEALKPGDIGSSVQAWSANLDEYAAVNPTPAGLALLDDADATAQKVTLGIGNVENTALSTWAGSANITAIGTLVSGTVPVARISGTLPVANGGSGIATLAANRIPYGNGTSAFQSSANATFDGNLMSIAGSAFPQLSISGVSAGVRMVADSATLPRFEFWVAGVRKWLIFSDATDRFVWKNNSVEMMSITQGGEANFAGKVFMGGATAPTARLHIAAGTTAASTAPLKLTSGSLMTTAEAGGIEFLTDKFYGTITTGAARKTFAFLESPVFTGRADVPSYTVATLPAVGAAGGMVFVTDAAVAACLAISNATNWKRCDNMATTVV